MPSFDSVGQEAQNKIKLAMERALNEQLFQQGVISKDMYEAAKNSLDQAAEGRILQ